MSCSARRTLARIAGVGGALFILASAAGFAQAQWVVKSEDGASSIRLGLLAQGRYELGKTEDIDAVSQNSYLRRARILFGGEIAPRISFFLETDSPNAGRPAEAVKAFGDVYLQDVVATYTFRDELLLDGGLILVPGAYNHLQSAATLLAIDYGPYTFVGSVPLEERVGRDTGLQARGILAGKLLEYRAGLFQGLRGPSQANPPRAVARLSLHPFHTASKGLFYTGTGLGKSRLLQIGAAVDGQKDYLGLHGDAFAELPVAPGSAVTLQGDVSSYDGGDLVAALPKQTTMMFEGGFTFLESRLALWAQASFRDFESKAKGDQSTVQIGGTVYLAGHRGNLKAAVARQSESAPQGGSAAPDRTSVTLQYQAFYF